MKETQLKKKNTWLQTWYYTFLDPPKLFVSLRHKWNAKDAI
jgi:hypothetical protein